MKYQLLLLCLTMFICSCKPTSKVSETDPEMSNHEDSTMIVDNEKAEQKEDMTLQPDDLLGCWLDSREENVPESGIKIYRPCDYPDIPPSRFRFRMELNKDKTCSWLTLSPTDAHYMSKGYWHMEDGNKIVLRNNKGVDVHILPVYSVGQGILKIQEETPSSSDQ